jgi:hypothetical protein
MVHYGYITLLLHAGSTIDADDLSVNPFAILASKETNHARNVNWQTNTVQRTPGCSILYRNQQLSIQ